MAIMRNSGRTWTRSMIMLALLLLAYLFCTGQLQEHGSALLDRLPAFSDSHSHSGSPALLPFVLEPLPLGSIKPSGWLRSELRAMANGLAGHEFDFYNMVKHSKWLGGHQEYSGLNEATPYWLNGLVPLAYALDDERLKAQVNEAVEYILDHQYEDGWLGPEQPSERLIWARFPLCLGLVQLAQANDTWRAPILHALHKFNKLLHKMLSDNGAGYLNQPLGDYRPPIMSWGRVRHADMMLTLQWLLENYPAGASQTLLANMRLLHQHGLQWEEWYDEDAYFGQGINEDLLGIDNTATVNGFHFMHGVNIAQGLKAPAVIRRFTHNDSLVQTAMNGYNLTMTYHGAASGTILADERLVGLAAFSGSELCTHVETIVSTAYLYQALGDAIYADAAELAAFNSLPAAVMPDWWAHQYVTAPNQPHAAFLPNQPFYNTNNWAQTFGLEPHYPCCTVNHPQGYPKFLSHSFARMGINGIAHMLLGPANAKTALYSGRASVYVDTAYPFEDDLHYTIKNDGPIDFAVRIPHWAGEQSFILVGDQDPAPLMPTESSRLHLVSLSAGQTNLSIHLQSSIRIKERANDTIAIYKGALLYAINVESSNTSTLPRQFKHPEQSYHDDYAPAEMRDYELHSTGIWKLAIDPSTLKWHQQRFQHPTDLSEPVFSPDANVGFLTVQGCEIDWPMLAEHVPDHPLPLQQRVCLRQVIEIKLIPYGSAKLHIADIPVIDLTHV